MGIPIGKLMLYTGLAGIRPSHLLPVVIDVGTNNQEYLDDPLYLGLRCKRIRGQEYDELIEEFVQAVKNRFGETCLIQFEDFANLNASRLLKKYENKCCTFNDDIQGTASVALAGILAGAKESKLPLKDQRFLIVGAGSAGIGIASLIAYAIRQENPNISESDSRSKIFLVDSRGLIVKDRPSGGISAAKAPWAHEGKSVKELFDIVKTVKPTALLGVSGQPKIFTKEILQSVAKNCERPFIFPMSNPNSRSECTAEEAYTHTNGKCLFGSGSPFPAYEMKEGVVQPSQANNAYVFPGVALAVMASGAVRVPNHVFYVAAKTLADLVPEEKLALGNLYPGLACIQQCSRMIAVKVLEYLYEKKLTTVVEPKKMEDLIDRRFYSLDNYPRYA